MTARTHLFVAAQKAPFGEAVLGMRLARELCARGDRVVFAAPDSLAVIVEKTPVSYLRIAEGKHDIDGFLVDTAKRERADSVVLLDVASTYMLLKALKLDEGFVARFDVPVLGLDVWDLRRTGRRWDMCGAVWDHSEHTLDVTKRLIPVPFARHDAGAGAYDAMPEAPPVDAGDRLAFREDVGLDDDDRLVLLTSAYWQHPRLQPHANGQRLAMLFPELIGELLGRLGPRVRVVHVGPEPLPVGDALAGRYTWLAPRSPERFARVLASVDLLVSFNFSATTIASAVAMGVPVLLGINGRSGSSIDEVVARMAEPASDTVRRWLELALPLCPFRVWPLGLHGFLEPLARSNPYTTAFRTVEVLELESFAAAASALLFDEGERDALRARQAAYHEGVRALPTGADVVRSHLGG